MRCFVIHANLFFATEAIVPLLVLKSRFSLFTTMNDSVNAAAGDKMTLSCHTPSTQKTVEIQWKVDGFQFLVDVKKSRIMSKQNAEEGGGREVESVEVEVPGVDIPDENILSKHSFPIHYDDNNNAEFFLAFIMLTKDLENITIHMQHDRDREEGKGILRSSQRFAKISATIYNSDGTIAVAVGSIDPILRDFSGERGGHGWGWTQLFPLSELDNLLDDDGALTVVLKVEYFFQNASMFRELSTTAANDETSFSKLSYDYLELLTRGDFTDFEIKVCEGEEHTRNFRCHKAMLAVRSPVFRAMLKYDSLESRTGTVEIAGVSGEVMKLFLEYLYSGRFSEDLEDSLRDIPTTPKWVKALPKLMELADKYAVQDLLELCDTKLILAVNKTNALTLMEWAQRLRLTNAVSELKQFILKNGDDIFCVPGKESATEDDDADERKDLVDGEPTADGVGDGDAGEV